MTSTPARSQIVWTQIDARRPLATSRSCRRAGLHRGDRRRGRHQRYLAVRRIPAAFPDRLTAEQQVPDISPPSVRSPCARGEYHPALPISPPPSRSSGRAIAELQGKGMPSPTTPSPRPPRGGPSRCCGIREGAGLGGQPGPARGELRTGAPPSVKNFARAPAPPRRLGPGDQGARRDDECGDFYGNEKSVVMADGGDLRIELVPADGSAPVVLAAKVPDPARGDRRRHLHERPRCAPSTPPRSRRPRPTGCSCRCILKRR